MKGISIDKLVDKDFTERNTGGVLQFKKTFDSIKIEKNLFYKVKGTDIILQLCKNHTHFDCRLNNRNVADYMHKITEQEFIKVVERVIHKDDFMLLNTLNDTDESEFESLHLDIKPQYMSNEEYLDILEDNFSYVYEVIRDVYTRNDVYDAKIYKSGGGFFNYYTEEDALTPLELQRIKEFCMVELGKLLGYFNSMEDLEPVKMNEHKKKEHPYSELYKLVNYIRETEHEIPNDIQLILDKGLLKELEQTSLLYKNKLIYDNK